MKSLLKFILCSSTLFLHAFSLTVGASRVHGASRVRLPVRKFENFRASALIVARMAKTALFSASTLTNGKNSIELM